MKKFLGMVLFTASAMITFLTGIASFVVGFRILKFLACGTVDTTSCLQFVITVVLFGVFIALTKIFGDLCGVDVEFTDDDEMYDTSSYKPQTIEDLINNTDE